MVARMQEQLKLTQENHPENAVEEPREKAPTVSLGSMVAISALCGLVGMTFGSAALSTAFMADTAVEVYSMIPLVATGAVFLCGWVGAFFWMCREEAAKRGS